MTNSTTRTASSPPTTLDDALERARAIAERLPDRWAETDRLRRLPDSTMAELRGSGLLRLNQPARFGGPELGIEAVLDVTAALAEGDVSVGWVCGVLGVHEWYIGLFPDEAQHDIWDDDPSTLMSASFAALKATVARVEGGWRITDGRWPFSSGSDHAQWAMVGFRIPAESEGAPSPVRWGIVPRSAYTVDDDWRTVAAQGTGSHTLSIVDTLIPDHRVLDPMLVVAGKAPGAEVNKSAMFRYPFGSAGFFLAGAALGGARAAVKDFNTYMTSKRLIFTGERIGTQGPMLAHLGEVAAAANVAEIVLRDMARRIDRSAADPMNSDIESAIQRDTAYAVRLCSDVVDETMRRSGGSALAAGHQANKWWRDVRAVAAHQYFNTDTAYSNWGRIVMGLPPQGGVIG